ncbi:phospholipase D family protein [Azospirillum sp. TSA6c]|uniref:phospholipase D family nuclease n=1 Tax=Azospirillum sp. TSA6c TaxID=709813 RepID=UPI001FFEE98F|nr:phospholipase D family protein [Azospirillum sp. TSA6c]
MTPLSMPTALRSIGLLCLLLGTPAAGHAEIPVVCFTPGGDCQGQIVSEIGKAKRQILVQAYSFTSAPIAKALVDAKKRGVDVQAVLDKSNVTGKYSGADFLRNGGVPVLIDRSHAIAHNKVMVIDGATVLTGSFNFTKAAQEKNAENLIVLQDSKLAGQYADNWHAHADHSALYEGRGN